MSAPIRPGRMVWIGLRPARREPMVPVEAATAEPGNGLIGDRYRSSRDGPRQVTLVQAEHLAAIAIYLGRDSIEPTFLRRNVVTQGINLLALKHRQFTLGTAVLEYTGECQPSGRPATPRRDGRPRRSDRLSPSRAGRSRWPRGCGGRRRARRGGSGVGRADNHALIPIAPVAPVRPNGGWYWARHLVTTASRLASVCPAVTIWARR
jgi:hypothetical protein